MATKRLVGSTFVTGTFKQRIQFAMHEGKTAALLGNEKRFGIVYSTD